MEQKVWSPIQGRLYPNCYVVLVAQPGVGKSVAIGYTEKLLRQVKDLKLAPSSVTAASLVDSMQGAVREMLMPMFMVERFNSLQVWASELQVFLKDYASDFMGLCTKFWDCEFYEELRRYGGDDKHKVIQKPQMSILAGTTASYLGELLGDAGWDQGFCSRTMFIFADKMDAEVNIFETPEDTMIQNQSFEDLAFDLNVMMQCRGQMEWTKGVQKLAQEWFNAGAPPVPEHARLNNYSSRRNQHSLKLAMIASMSRSDELVVTEEDFEIARGWMLEAEEYMPLIFRNVSKTPEARIMEDAEYYMQKLYENKFRGPIPEHFLYQFLRGRVQSQHLARLVDVMVRSKMLNRIENPSNSTVWFLPSGAK